MSAEEKAKRLVILGAAGRDFHDFNVFWKARRSVEVVAFTAAQIPGIGGRVYPPELAGERYPRGIPIEDEGRLEEVIGRTGADAVTLAYSDLSYAEVGHLASRAGAAGASFVLLGAARTMLPSALPVVSVCAVRTGCGKSQAARRVVRILRELGRRPVVIRHPMPYGDLRRQAVQRFASRDDLVAHACTIEEREEYEPHLAMGTVLFAGIDYEKILRAAEAEGDVIVWDGGNNDTPFVRPTLHVVLADPLRAGHELAYYPGETNLRLADLVIVNKVDAADAASVERVEAGIRAVNPRAAILRAASPVVADDPGAIAGRSVLVVEDGPTLTHGGMLFGAGVVAARRYGAASIVDPRPFARGSIREVLERYPRLTEALPAMGYGARQLEELEATIDAAECDAVVVGTPIDLGRLLRIRKPAVRVRYELEERDPAALRAAIAGAVAARPA